MLFIKKTVADHIKSMGRKEKSEKLQQELDALLKSKPQEDYPASYMFLATMIRQENPEGVTIMTVAGETIVTEKK